VFLVCLDAGIHPVLDSMRHLPCRLLNGLVDPVVLLYVVILEENKMSELFSEEWIKTYAEQWNAEPDLSGKLEKIDFSSSIAYGFDGEEQPRCYIKVENGKVVESGVYDGQEINWDLRAAPDTWQKWLKKPPGMMGMGMAYTSRKLKFQVGDYAAMIKDPRMAGPFIKSFAVMGRV
jgi:hypothetical protein